jgi:hypothetical protein
MATLLKSKEKVHIFSTGEWNGQKFNADDLDEMVIAFNETKDLWQPPGLKLGHDEEQLFLQKEGLPAAGWVSKIYRVGEKLYADLVDIPEKVYQLIENKAYRRVSIEQYRNVKFNDKMYKYMVGAVALLGAEMPGVMDLSDILSLYGFKDRPTIKSITSDQSEVTTNLYSIANEEFHEEESSMTEAELKAQLEMERAKREAAEGEAKKFKADADAEKARAEKAEREKAEADKAVFAAQAKAKQAELESQVDSLISEKLITKGMRPYALALLGEEPETAKFSLKLNDKDVELSKFELVKEMAKLFAKKAEVNLDESSLEGEKGGDKQPTQADIEKYASDNKVSFSQAARQLLKKALSRKTDDVTEA